jgi:hypothetical protein
MREVLDLPEVGVAVDTRDPALPVDRPLELGPVHIRTLPGLRLEVFVHVAGQTVLV